MGCSCVKANGMSHMSLAAQMHHQAVNEAELVLARFSNLSAKSQMVYILSYWLRQYSLDILPGDIINFIIDEFTYQSAFDEDPLIAISRENNKDLPFDHLFKLIFAGDSLTGKSAILQRYVDDSYTSSFIGTIGVDFKIKTIDIENAKIKLQIWDIAGQPRFRTIARAYFPGVHGVLMVYDVTWRGSFENIREWNEQFEQRELRYVKGNVPKILIGAKCDMINDREVSTSEAEELCKELNIKHYIEVSAKEGTNVSKAFDIITRECYQGIKRTKYPFFG